jgi:hypothetical protein
MVDAIDYPHAKRVPKSFRVNAARDSLPGARLVISP